MGQNSDSNVAIPIMSMKTRGEKTETLNIFKIKMHRHHNAIISEIQSFSRRFYRFQCGKIDPSYASWHVMT